MAGLSASSGSSPLISLAASFTTVSVVNAVNFMDGINGITGLTSLVWGLNAACSELSDVAWIGAVTAGAGLGFLPWNAPTARLFLGDSGSYLLGGLMALGIVRTMVRSRRIRESVLIGAPLLPYGVDVAQAIIRRAASGVALTEAHREHVYQQLVDHAGMSHLQVATIHAALASAIAVTWRRVDSPAVATTGAVAMLASYLVLPKCLRSTEL
ncbi:hypothetical protein GCM10027572_04410 [Flexivirga lutea]